MLTQKLKRTTQKYHQCLSKIEDLKQQKSENSPNVELITKLVRNAEAGDEKAAFLLDLLKNHFKQKPRWSEQTIRMSIIWRFCSPKGYRFCHTNLFKVPSKSTLSRFLGEYKGQNVLIKQRLEAEVQNFRVPVERVCSLIVDDMSVKERIQYSRTRRSYLWLGYLWFPRNRPTSPNRK